MGEAYPDLVTNRDGIVTMIAREEERFRQTLARGSVLLDDALDRVPDGGTLDGAVAFELHDTYGFPLEVTKEMAELRGVEVDDLAFVASMDAQRERSRAAGRKTGVAAGDDADALRALLAERGPTEFTGRDEFETVATVVGIIGDGLYLDRTPFYAESGGQVGDTGTVTTDTGTVRITDTT